MKNDNRTDEYRRLKNKLFIRTSVMLAAAFFAVVFLYVFIMQDHIANFIVFLLQVFIYHNYDEALYIYSNYIRGYMGIFFFISVTAVFMVMLRIYLNRFTKYFNEISRGVDSLADKSSPVVSLSPELTPLEKKINSVKHTLAKQSEEIRTAEQQKNDLIMYLAHDLKTPLASVLGYLNLMRDELQISEELREKYLSIAIKKTERLEELINEFFEISRYSLTGITLNYSTINLTRLLEQLIFEFEPGFKEKELRCTLDMEENITLDCDADKIQRVFDNLLRNAVFYSYLGSEITVSASRTASEIKISVINCGDTIPHEKLTRLFEQFYRLDSSRGSNSGGAGLGLAIAKQIVEMHNGSITAESADNTVKIEVLLPVS